MHIVYAFEHAPQRYTKSIFLAGPTPRDPQTPSWRPDALRILEESGYDGVVFVPEARDGKWRSDYDGQLEWEDKHLNMADCIIFWVPRELKVMPAFTTNDEWGTWKYSGKCTFGAPTNAVKVNYQRYYAKKLVVPNAQTLEETIALTLNILGDGADRADGEREVPLYIWRTPSFQQWYRAQRNAGNRLDGARVEWTFRAGPKKNFMFYWALHVDIYIASEDRHKTNEVVIARPDIATIVMYKRAEKLDDAVIVLIREFRSPAATSDGFVWEIPGGSSFKPGGNPLQLAADECREETGLEVDASRLVQHDSRQLAATLSAHKAHVFSVEVTDDELAWLRSEAGIARGVAEDSERTYVEVKTLGEIRKEGKVDWSMLGMIMSVVA